MSTKSTRESTPNAAIVADTTIAEEKWTGPRLFMLGVATLAVALTIIDLISGSTTPH
jgi:hypothetical protein